MELPDEPTLGVKFDIFGNLLRTPDIKLHHKLFNDDNIKTNDTNTKSTNLNLVEDDKGNHSHAKITLFTPTRNKTNPDPVDLPGLGKRSPLKDITSVMLCLKKVFNF
jgi:hypothetical protein